MTTTQATFDTPRILPEHLQAFYAAQAGPNTPGYTVRLLGTCTSLNGSTGTLSCGGFGEISVVLKTDARLQVGRLFEVVGKVIQLDNGQGLGLRVLGAADWGNPDDCDYHIYELLVNATHRCTNIFYTVL